MNKLKLLIHSGSGNRVCEAIIRGTSEVFGKNFDLEIYSVDVEQDKKVKLDEVVRLNAGCFKYGSVRGFIKHCEDYVSYKFGNGKLQVKNIYGKMIKEIKSDDITMVIGGDVYCYGKPYVYYRFNDLLKSKFRIFYGCSIEPDTIDQEMKNDLNKYNIIIARESITYNALKSNGINHSYLLPDPAFLMRAEEIMLDDFFVQNDVIGINLSPLISNLGRNKEIVFDSYLCMINYILKNTQYSVALIPHVIWETSNDYKILNELYNEINDKSKVKLIDAKYNAQQLKYIIGKCKMFIGARTHSTIAAYSQCIPTLVIGYSVKARGIAKDLFGTEENYVFPVQKITNENDLIAKVKWLIENYDSIKKHLEKIMPNYILKTGEANNILLNEMKRNKIL